MKTMTKDEEDFVLSQARSIIMNRMRKPGGIIADINVVKQYLTEQYGLLEVEQFGCMFLDRNYSLINHMKMFRGTVDHCATYPREIAREALLQNASFVIMIHNHPLHKPLPSEDDIVQTKRMQEILAAVDIALFDHLIVAGLNMYSLRSAGHLN
jgi:DNA repair protein RadC